MHWATISVSRMLDRLNTHGGGSLRRCSRQTGFSWCHVTGLERRCFLSIHQNPPRLLRSTAVLKIFQENTDYLLQDVFSLVNDQQQHEDIILNSLVYSTTYSSSQKGGNVRDFLGEAKTYHSYEGDVTYGKSRPGTAVMEDLDGVFCVLVGLLLYCCTAIIENRSSQIYEVLRNILLFHGEGPQQNKNASGRWSSRQSSCCLYSIYDIRVLLTLYRRCYLL